MASGACDNLVLATFLSATCPVVVAPAMDEDMWHHPSTKYNLQRLQAFNCQIIPVGYGELASGLTGEGRMAEPEEMVGYLHSFFALSGSLAGKKVLITAGPTYEAIDPVRFIGNHSSGKMGYHIAEAFQQAGAKVVLVSGPVKIQAPMGVELVKTTSAEEMAGACLQHTDYDIAIMAAAVADYTPVESRKEKIKKTDGELVIKLQKTKDILASLGEQKKPGQVLVGFALETNNEASYAQSKLERKNADLIIMNSLRDAGAGFGGDTNKVSVFYKDGRVNEWPLQSKTAVAKAIVKAIIEL
jgi:phosphopantothenoylcysteine decarboxylase/phosphopantothenate--cysteine ligase